MQSDIGLLLYASIDYDFYHVNNKLLLTKTKSIYFWSVTIICKQIVLNKQTIIKSNWCVIKIYELV